MCAPFVVAVVVSTGAGFRGCPRFRGVFPPFVVCSVLLSCLLSLCCLCFPAIALKYALFRVFGAFWRGLGASCGFVLLACFAWLVWLLCACGVRRIEGLWRVCPCFLLLCPYFPLFCPAFILLLCFLSFYLLCSGCLCLFSCIVFSFLLCLCCFLFPYGRIDKKKGRAVLVRPLLSCCGIVISL